MTVYSVIKRMMTHLPLASAAAFFLLLLSSIAPVISLYFFHQLVSGLFAGTSGNIFIPVLFYLFFSLVFPFIVRAGYEQISLTIQEHMDHLFSGNALKQTQNVSIRHIESGEGVNRAFRASQTQADGIQQLAFSVIDIGSVLVQAAILTLSLGWPGLGLLVVIAVFACPLYRINKRSSELNLQSNWELEEEQRKSETLFAVLTSRVAAAELWLYRLRSPYMKRYSQQQEYLNRRHSQNYAAITKFTLRAETVLQLCFLVLLGFVGFLYFFQSYEAAFCITLVYASQTLLSWGNGLVQKLIQYNRQSLILQEYNAIFKWRTQSTPSGDNSVLLHHQLCLNNVSYRYERQNFNALDAINLTIRKGEKIVLVGMNGSGKSTLIRILMGYELPTHGEYTIDGQPADKVLHRLWDRTTIMFQKFWKYNLNVEQNIILSDPDHGEPHRLTNVLDKLDMSDLFKHLEQGMQTEVVNGGLFSGGQWQKIALARAYYREKEIIVMDEPNAAIDPLYELKMYQNFMEMFQGKTAVMVSHRLPICQLADRIIVLDRGTIAEDGSHEQLLKNKGLYYNMFIKQAEMYH